MQPLRPLLPRQQSTANPSSPGSSTDQDNTPAVSGRAQPPRGRRPHGQKNSPLACDACRRRKSKCNGQLPKCSLCQRRGEVCSYTYSVRRNVTVVQGENGISSTTEENAALSSSEHWADWALTRAVVPPPHHSFEFELTLRHGVAYPALALLPNDGNPLESSLRPCFMETLKNSVKLIAEQTQQPTATLPTIFEHPLLIAPLFDERLCRVNFASWTSVQIPNHVAISVLSNFFSFDFSTMTVFNAELFIQDLLDERSFFCSSLLVNTLLCWACQAYASLSSDLLPLSHALLEEARRDLQETTTHTITAVAALQILSEISSTRGRDDLSLQQMHQSISMGKSMGLFDVSNHLEAAQAWLNGHDDWLRAASYTAWGVYNLLSLRALNCRPLVSVVPSILPKPNYLGTGARTASDERRDREMKHAQSLSVSSELWVIVQQIMQRYYVSQATEPSHDLLAFAEHVFGQLLGLAARLPLDLARDTNISHDMVLFHIHFHAAVTDLFRPFLASPAETYLLATFESPFATPSGAFDASVKQLRRLVLFYTLRFKSATYSILSTTPLLYLANTAIRPSREVEATGNHGAPWSNQDARDPILYLDLCFSGLKDLHAAFPAIGCVALALVGTALRHEAVDNEKARRLVREIRQQRRKHASSGFAVDGMDVKRIVDFELALSDPVAAQAHNLEKQSEYLLGLKKTAENVANTAE